MKITTFVRLAILPLVLNFVPVPAASRDKIDSIIDSISQKKITDTERVERLERFYKKGVRLGCSTDFDIDYATCANYIDTILLAVEQDQKFEKAFVRLENAGVKVLIVNASEKIDVVYSSLFRAGSLRIPLYTKPNAIRSFLEI